jgi:AhpD family alkylhydroperoxidase
MRLCILNDKYSLGTKILFTLIELVTRQALPDAAKLSFFRRRYYGLAMGTLTHEVMRGESAWSVGDRELMAALVSKAIQSPFCIAAHSAAATLAYNDDAKVRSALSNLDASPISERLRATLEFLGKVASGRRIDGDDLQIVLRAGVTRQQIEDALEVCFAFSVTARLANAFDFKILSPDGFAAGAAYLLKRGYR